MKIKMQIAGDFHARNGKKSCLEYLKGDGAAREILV